MEINESKKPIGKKSIMHFRKENVPIYDTYVVEGYIRIHTIIFIPQQLIDLILYFALRSVSWENVPKSIKECSVDQLLFILLNRLLNDDKFSKLYLHKLQQYKYKFTKFMYENGFDGDKLSNNTNTSKEFGQELTTYLGVGAERSLDKNIKIFSSLIDFDLVQIRDLIGKDTFQANAGIFILKERVWIGRGSKLVRFVFDLRTFALRLVISPGTSAAFECKLQPRIRSKGPRAYLVSYITQSKNGTNERSEQIMAVRFLVEEDSQSFRSFIRTQNYWKCPGCSQTVNPSLSACAACGTSRQPAETGPALLRANNEELAMLNRNDFGEWVVECAQTMDASKTVQNMIECILTKQQLTDTVLMRCAGNHETLKDFIQTKLDCDEVYFLQYLTSQIINDQTHNTIVFEKFNSKELADYVQTKYYSFQASAFRNAKVDGSQYCSKNSDYLLAGLQKHCGFGVEVASSLIAAIDKYPEKTKKINCGSFSIME